MKLSCLIALLSLSPFAAIAEAPKVVTDIAPVQSLVAGVMEGVGVPVAVVPPGASPHSHAMRPSQARALQQSDLVVWIGPELSPGLSKALGSLAESAQRLDLLDLEGTVRLAFRETVIFQHETHDHEPHGQDDDHAHDDDHGHADSHDHGHEGTDPHAWLDPVNAQLWVKAIATQLSEIDPGNAAVYHANSDRMQSELQDLIDETSAALAPVRDQRFVVFHDAYQYFEKRFGLKAAGALLQSDGTPPSAARLREISGALSEGGIACVFSEPQFDARLMDAVARDGALAVAILDPIGINQSAGPGHYAETLRAMARAFEACLSEK